MLASVAIEWPAKAVVVETVGGGVTVIAAGVQGPPGPVGASASFVASNGSGGVIAAGTPVSVSSSAGSQVLVASAINSANPCVGLSIATANNAESVTVQTGGKFTQLDWTSITGGTDLVLKGKYFLGLSGTLTVTPQTATGRILQYVGVAVSNHDLILEIANPILL